jgi:mono/diheme cytochrome c family protein
MKKIIKLRRSFLLLVAFLILGDYSSGFSQKTKEQSYPIPENINKIFETSCFQCHGKKGRRLPKTRLNFSRWEAYGVSKKVEKASMICSVVSKGSMPPRRIRESNPELILTKEQAQLICSWAESLKAGKY